MLVGAEPLCLQGPEPRPGDVIVSVSWGELARRIPHRRLLERRVWDAPGGRVLSHVAGAGFYANGWGYLPWSWGRDELGRVEVWRVTE
jgi:hypothetical protein